MLNRMCCIINTNQRVPLLVALTYAEERRFNPPVGISLVAPV